MAQRNSDGVCQKLYKAVGPFRSTIRLITRLPLGSVAFTNDQKPLPQTKPVNLLHQSKMIPIEFDSSAAHFPAQEHKKSVTFSAGKENSIGKPRQDSADREIQIGKSHKPAPGKREAARSEKVIPVLASSENEQTMVKVKPNEDTDPFSNYIDKVKGKLMGNASHIGGADRA